MHCYLCFTLWLPCKRWLVMQLQAQCDVSNVDGVNMAQFLFDVIELGRFWCLTWSNITSNCVQKPCRFECPLPTVYFWYGFSSLLHSKKHLLKPFETSNDLLVVLANYVPRYEWILSEKATKKSMGLFLISNNVWKYNLGFSIVLSAVLHIVKSYWKNEDYAKLDCFCDFSDIFNEGVRM